MTSDAAQRFVDKRKAEGTGNAAINRSLAAMRRMFNLAKKSMKIREVPYIEFLKEPDPRKGFVEVEQFNKLFRLLPTHLRPLITFLYDCGTRIGEALQIDWVQVDVNARLIYLEPEQTKNA